MGDLENNALSESDFSQFALVAVFDGPENLKRTFDVVLQYSNKYTAAVLYACFQDFMGHPGQAYYHIRRLNEAYPLGAAFELEAALFAHIRDEPSFKTYVGAHELWPGSHEKTVEINMYSSFAWRLARRSQPYMVNEWTRLSKFTQNERAKAAAAFSLMKGALTSLSSSQSRTDEFSSLADGVRRLFERACYRKVFAKHTSAVPLPTPYEKFSIRLGPKIKHRVSVIILDDENSIVSQATIGKEDVFLLPSVDQTAYVLRIDRGNPYAVGFNHCNFIVKPQFTKD